MRWLVWVFYYGGPALTAACLWACFIPRSQAIDENSSALDFNREKPMYSMTIIGILLLGAMGQIAYLVGTYNTFVRLSNQIR
jgi:hypothetical protein